MLFFIHGGAFVTGGGADYDGAFLAARGPAIIVTINYRLGPLGFLPLHRHGGALADAKSTYEHTVAAVCEMLPAATNQEVRRAQRLAQAGPPAEAVGLQPFTLTVPPKRSEGD